MKCRSALAMGAVASLSLSLLVVGQPGLADPAAPPGDQFYTALRARTVATVGNILNTPIYAIEPAAQGDFMWNWQNTDNDFNNLTYQYVSAQVTPGSSPDSVALSE